MGHRGTTGTRGPGGQVTARSQEQTSRGKYLQGQARRYQGAGTSSSYQQPHLATNQGSAVGCHKCKQTNIPEVQTTSCHLGIQTSCHRPPRPSCTHEGGLQPPLSPLATTPGASIVEVCLYPALTLGIHARRAKPRLMGEKLVGSLGGGAWRGVGVRGVCGGGGARACVRTCVCVRVCMCVSVCARMCVW